MEGKEFDEDFFDDIEVVALQVQLTQVVAAIKAETVRDVKALQPKSDPKRDVDEETHKYEHGWIFGPAAFDIAGGDNQIEVVAIAPKLGEKAGVVRSIGVHENHPFAGGFFEGGPDRMAVDGSAAARHISNAMPFANAWRLVVGFRCVHDYNFELRSRLRKVSGCADWRFFSRACRYCFA